MTTDSCYFVMNKQTVKGAFGVSLDFKETMETESWGSSSGEHQHPQHITLQLCISRITVASLCFTFTSLVIWDFS